MHRIGVFLYGVFAYACFLATFLYAMGFVGGFGVPRARGWCSRWRRVRHAPRRREG